jgi:hypothetical protein
MINRRMAVASVLAATVAPAAAAPSAFTPESFGARGDGVTNDSLAFARLAKAVNMRGGGEIVLRKVTYIVGQQGLALSGQYLFPPVELLRLEGCSLPLIIKGNGARLMCPPGLRYGVFGSDGNRNDNPMPYLGAGRASPYRAMVEILDCTGLVAISDLELVGPGDALILGGQFGDTGWQIPATGLMLRNNRGGEIIERVQARAHPQDGLLIDGFDGETTVRRTLIDVSASENGRQGCSIVGGRGYSFTRCRFQRTGRGKVRSAPGAGVDIEAEGGKRIRNLSFTACVFADNMGAGMVADSGDSERVRFSNCTFIGTSSWSAWPRKPFFRFERCTFVGAICSAFGDPDPQRAAQFTDCKFTDDLSRSGNKRVYGGPLADLSDAKNVTFIRCNFRAVRGTLPWSTGAVYRDCVMFQGMQTAGYPRGRFVGRNTIIGRVDLYGSTITGSLVVNGQPKL